MFSVSSLPILIFTHIHTHIPIYVSKDKIFVLFTLANYGPIYLIDFTNM